MFIKRTTLDQSREPLRLWRKGLVNCQQATCNSLQESCSLIRLQEYLLIIFMITIRWRPKSRNALGEKTVYFLENGIVQYIYILVIEKCPQLGLVVFINDHFSGQKVNPAVLRAVVYDSIHDCYTSLVFVSVTKIREGFILDVSFMQSGQPHPRDEDGSGTIRLPYSSFAAEILQPNQISDR